MRNRSVLQEHAASGLLPPPSSEVTEGLTSPSAFSNLGFLSLLCGCDFSRLSVEAAVIRARLAAVFRSHGWPIFVAEIDSAGDAFRLEVFPDRSGEYGSHYGGEPRSLTAEEWRVVFGEVEEAGESTGVGVVLQDAAGLGWVVASARRKPEDAAAVRAKRLEAMELLAAAVPMRWPEGWLAEDRVAGGRRLDDDARVEVGGVGLSCELVEAAGLPLGRLVYHAIRARGRGDHDEDARARRFWREARRVEADELAARPPEWSPRSPLDWEREWGVRYLPPTASELARATEASVEARRLEAELLRRSEPPRPAPGRSRDGGPWRELDL